MHRLTRIKITDLNPHLMCVLCGGYYMDATTIIECLHSFCKSCIVRYLETSKYCPICDVQIHKTKPLLSIRSDQTLQEIVYKLVPGLFQNEMKRRRDFYAQHPQEAAKIPSCGYSEERGEVEGGQRFVGNPNETINFSLEYSNGSVNCARTSGASNERSAVENSRRYLHCPTAVTVALLKKFVRAKYGLSAEHKVEILCYDDCLDDDFSLMDISYIYSWRRKGPLRLFYKMYEKPTISHKKLKIIHQPDEQVTNPLVKDQICPLPTEETRLSADDKSVAEIGNATVVPNDKHGTNNNNHKKREVGGRQATTTPVATSPATTAAISSLKMKSTPTDVKVNKTKLVTDGRRTRKRMRSEEAVIRKKTIFPVPSSMPSVVPTTPWDKSRSKAEKETPSACASAPRVNGNASSTATSEGEFVTQMKMCADKENKGGGEDKELIGLVADKKVNGIVGAVDGAGEKKVDALSSILGKT